MNSAPVCEHCGRPRPASSLNGLCPACLARISLTFSDDSALGEPPALDDPPLPSAQGEGPRFGDYLLLEEIGRGGMGIVYRARQLTLNRVVALKLIPFGLLATAESTRRFQAEATAAAQLQHPNIVAVHEFGEWQGQRFFSMDYIEGGTLAEHLRNGPWPIREAAALVQTVARAVQHAHEAGIIHRDLKPANILIDRQGQPHIADFGIAKRIDPDSVQTLTGQAFGSPHYMPPEQADSNRAKPTPRTDIYSLGAVLYHALTGRPPFQAETIEGVLHLLLTHEPVAPRLLNPSVPRDLETVCLKCLEKDPLRRYATAQHLADDLGRWLNGEPVLARPVRVTGRFVKWCRRRPAIATLGATTLLAAVLGFTGILWQWRAAFQANRQLAEKVSELRLQRANDQFRQDDTPAALLTLAAQIRDDPNDHRSISRLIAALTKRDFLLPLRMVGPSRLEAGQIFWSPDQQRVLVASGTRGGTEGELTLWDVNSGNLLGEPLRFEGLSALPEFSGDGRWLITSVITNGVLFCDPRTLRQITNPPWSALPDRASRIQPHGRLLALYGVGPTIELRDLSNGASTLTLTNESDAVLCEFSPDGKYCAAGDSSGAVTVWQLEPSFARIAKLSHDPPSQATAFEFNADASRFAVTLSGKGAALWSIPAAGRIALPEVPCELAAFSPDGRRLLMNATVAGQFVVSVADASSGQIITNLYDLQIAPPRGFSPRGTHLALLRMGELRLYDPVSLKPTSEPLSHRWPVEKATFSPSDSSVAVVASLPNVCLWDTRPGRLVPRTFAPGGKFATLSNRGHLVATASETGRVQLYDSVTLTPQGAPFELRSGITQLEFSRDDTTLSVGLRAGEVKLLELARSTTRSLSLTETNPLNHLTLSPDGKILAILHYPAFLRFWNHATGQPLTPSLDVNAGLPGGFGENVSQISFTPNGQFLALASYRGAVVFYETGSTNRIVRPWHEAPVAGLAFTPDGRWIATAGFDQRARLWNVQDGTPRSKDWMHHDSPVTGLDVSADGRWLVTGAFNTGKAYVWDAASGRSMAVIDTGRNGIRFVKASPDGQRFASSSFDGFVQIWEIRSGVELHDPIHLSGSYAERLAWSRDGQRLFVGTASDVVQVIELPLVPVPAPTWLPELAQALGGATPERSPGPALLQLRDHVSQLPANDFYTRWAHWFFADRSNRAPFPYTP